MSKLDSNRLRTVTIITSLTISLISCGGGSTGTPDVPLVSTQTGLEREIRKDLNDLSTDTDFTLLVKTDNDRLFSHSIGSSTESVSYRSASTSKLVTAAVILSLVNDGILSFADNPQNYIAGWPTSGNLAAIQLRDLLNFTSGLENEPACIHLANSNIEDCVDNIRDQNTNSPIPGSEFFYSSAHMQVAGLMAIRASGLSSWDEVFDGFKTQTGLFTTSVFDLPSTQNPRLAGGMHWTASEYLDFLEALYNNTILSTALIQQMFSDQISNAVVVSSPAINGITEDWHYGFGNWIECQTIPFNCTTTTKISSPGAYGAYPFIDFDNHYFGIIAREGTLGSFSEGYAVFKTVEDKLVQWSRLDRNLD
ncbi:MAG: serine hydrolase domain-containing protein [Cellvibrionaceae bacterium]